MTKPMYCPMSFANRSLTEPHYMSIGDKHGQYVEEVKPWMECTPDCAWAVNDGKEYWCGMMNDQAWNINTKPLKDVA